MREPFRHIIAPPITESDVPAARDELDGYPNERAAALTELLQSEESARIALYLPWQWLPAPHEHEYLEAYKDAWWSLLTHIDQRADFIDGDIGERNDGKTRPFVAKAAHLAPLLQRAGILTHDEIEHIYRETNSIVLRRSIDDTHQPYPTESSATVATLHEHLSRISRQSELGDYTDARRRWLSETAIRSLTREAARNTSLLEAEQLTEQEDPLLTLVALRALTRHKRHGKGEWRHVEWTIQQTRHDNVAIRRQAATSLRHLYHQGFISASILDEASIILPRLSGSLSENAAFMQPSVDQLLSITEKIATHPTLAITYFPVVLVGGSRIKGYGDERSDLDTTIITRPGYEPNAEQLRELFGDDAPLPLQTEQTPTGIAIKETAMTDKTWSHLVYSTLWIGDASAIESLRRDFTNMYDDQTLRHGALRRLEQDSLQYRLLHKGYEQHYPIEADDMRLPSGGIDRNSVFWDEGYRTLATKLFVEKVRLPRVK